MASAVWFFIALELLWLCSVQLRTEDVRLLNNVPWLQILTLHAKEYLWLVVGRLHFVSQSLSSGHLSGYLLIRRSGCFKACLGDLILT